MQPEFSRLSLSERELGERWTRQPKREQAMSAFHQETVTSVHHWTDDLFSFTTSRDPAFRFRSGEFTMLGLEVDGRPLMRAYSVVSAPYEDSLEFFSIKVANGPLTSRLRHIAPGDRIMIGRKATGTLVIDNLKPGRRLLLLGTGTGLAPFLSIIRDPATYDMFDSIVLVHGTRHVAELAYAELISDQLPANELIGDLVRERLVYYPTVTREPYRNRGRVTDLMTSGKLFEDIGQGALDPATDRVMLCGSPQMVADTRDLLTARGFAEASNSVAGEFALERAFVER